MPERRDAERVVGALRAAGEQTRLRVLALTLDAERAVLAARTAGMDGVELVGVEDVGEAGSVPASDSSPAQQLATLAVRLEMAAVYLRLAGG